MKNIKLLSSYKRSENVYAVLGYSEELEKYFISDFNLKYNDYTNNQYYFDFDEANIDFVIEKKQFKAVQELKEHGRTYVTNSKVMDYLYELNMVDCETYLHEIDGYLVEWCEKDENAVYGRILNKDEIEEIDFELFEGLFGGEKNEI